MQRIPTDELLDRDGGTPEQVAASLEDLRKINRWFGGVRVVATLLRRVAAASGKRTLTLLDVASASGDVVATVTERLTHSGIEVKSILLDRVHSHLPKDRVAVLGDALALPFADNSVDVVCASLFVHHLDPAQARRFAQEAWRVCRQAVIINDLRRSRTHLALVYSGAPLFRSHITRHDSVASVKQAYTVAEMREMLSGLPARVEIERFYLCRMGAVLWKTGR